jgi:hypothetical protein
VGNSSLLYEWSNGAVTKMYPELVFNVLVSSAPLFKLSRTAFMTAYVLACKETVVLPPAARAASGLPPAIGPPYIAVHVRRGDKASLDKDSNAQQQKLLCSREDARLSALVDSLLADPPAEMKRARTLWTVIGDDSGAVGLIMAHLRKRGVRTVDPPVVSDAKVASLLDFATLASAQAVVSSSVASDPDLPSMASYSSFAYMASRLGGSTLYSTSRYYEAMPDCLNITDVVFFSLPNETALPWSSKCVR